MNPESKKNEGKVDKSLMMRENTFDLIGDIDNLKAAAQKLMQTPHYAKLGQEGIFAIIQKAKSLNTDPLDALNGGLYYLNGKVGMSAELMCMLIRMNGHSISKDAKSNDEICILHGRRSDNGDTWTESFSIADAKRAGIYKNTWEKYPRNMIYCRALSNLARQLFPDVIKGCYEIEELKSFNTPVPQIEHHTQEPEQPKQLISQEQADELLGLLEKCPKEFAANVSKWVTNKYGRFDRIEVKDFTSLLERVTKKLEEPITIKVEEVANEA
jgi:hypothetical protein